MTEIDRLAAPSRSTTSPRAPAGAPVVLRYHCAPGSGSFDPDPDATATIGLAADDAAAVLADLLPAGATAGVAGWSAGGRVALALAARHPELVGRVSVIAAPAPDEEVPGMATRTARWSTRCAPSHPRTPPHGSPRSSRGCSPEPVTRHCWARPGWPTRTPTC